MKLIKTEEAVGHILCQDMTQIIAGKSKGPRFKKGHVVTEKDVPVLLSMGKVNLYVWEMESGMVHENDAAHRLAELCLGPGCVAAGEPSEGKIGINAACCWSTPSACGPSTPPTRSWSPRARAALPCARATPWRARA